ncbi:MAG: T9SS type A sorting domain-containing protein [Bacteroidetes bacterium]|nr:T9SS type A sorting domain-containing protein [Bacteroidota bacterium]
MRSTFSILITALSLLTVKANAQWDSVGNQGFTSSSINYPSIVVNSASIPYISFYDGSLSGKATVMNYSGGSWSAVGTAGFSLGTASYTSLTLDNNDTPYVAYEDGGKTSKAIVKKYNGSSWVFAGDSTGISSGSATYINLARNKNNELYLAYVDGSKSSRVTVKKYNTSSGNWDSVGNMGFSANSASWLSLTFDTSGLPYVAYADGGSGNKLSVMRDSDNIWVYVGTAGVSANGALCNSIVIDASNIPYVSYRDGSVSNKLTVLEYSGGSWAALGGTGFTINPAAYTSMHIDSHNIPYVAYDDFTINKARAVRYSSGSWSAVGDTVFSGGSATRLASFMDSHNNLYAVYPDGSRSSKATVMRYLNGTTWDGSSWNNGTPGDTVDAVIASGTAPSSFSCNNLYINSGVSLNTGTSVVVTVKGNLINNGNGVSGTGTLKFSNSGTSNISGNTVKFGGKVQVLSGCTLATNNLLVLTSDATNTGSIGQSAGTISGNVGVQRYIPGKRCFRFFGHPFTDSMALSQLTDSIDITGAGGSTNGFTTTPTNNPSAFWFDPTLADTSTTGTNPGWVAFTSATTTSWKQYQLLRLLVRGAKGEGLTGGSYTPSAATFQAKGTINQGTQIVTLTKGANSEFVGCGNPYPSGVDMSTLVLGSNVGANYYAWDATAGTSGAYVTNAFSLSYVLPSFSAFFTTVSANTNNTIEFDESSKASGGASIFKTTGSGNWVELQLADSNTHWDRLLVKLDDKAADTVDRQDAIKLYNPSLDFYTLSKEGKRLAIDARPYADSASIELGLTAYKMYKHYVIKTGMYNIPAGAKLYLHDKYLGKTEELTAGYAYWFEVTSDSNSQGVNRFELNMVGEPTTGVATTKLQSNKLQVIPNPAHSSIELNYNKQQGAIRIAVMNMAGQVVYSKQTDGNAGKTVIAIQNLPAGTYIAEISGANLHVTEKFIKE